MKKLSYLLIAFVAAFTITSCDLNPEVQFDHTYESDLNIDIPAGSKSYSFDVNTVLDPMSSEDFAAYKDLINELNVTGIEGLIAKINKTVEISNLNLLLKSAGQEVSFTKDLMVFEEGKLITFEEVSNEFNTISTWLTNNQEIEIHLKGEASEDDVQINFTTRTGMSVVADPL